MFTRLIWSLAAITWMAFIFAMSSTRQFSQPFGLSTFFMSIAAHMILYGVLALLLLFAVDRSPRRARSSMTAAIAIAALYGVSDEFHQSFVPGRDASVLDLLVNTAGATIAVVVWSFRRSAIAAVTSR
ncbi:MAG: VanZ family protein [Chloroflexota bacterium]|nr:VanZ family protein [Chloroflexota bacterium]